MRRLVAGLMVALMLLTFAGCKKAPESEYLKYSESFFDTFNSITMVVAYTKTEAEFDGYFEKIKSRFQELHKLYDIYNLYDGINNIKTINDNAGIQPVKVDKEIIDLLLYAKDWYNRTDGKMNIAFGAVLRIWHDYREAGKDDPQNAKLPPMESLKNAAEHIDIDKLIIDTEKSTVYLTDEKMSLDVGAVAKGYATEVVAKEIMEQGMQSGIISAGGNIRVLGKPLDGIRERWGIGIQDPDKPIVSDEEHYLDIVFLNNLSVVSSGDYERYYTVKGKKVHHLIDPVTFMPGDYYRAVTIVTENSGLADVLSTAVFLMPYEQSLDFVESLDGVEVIWVMKDGEVRTTEGMKKILKSNGATGAKSK